MSEFPALLSVNVYNTLTLINSELLTTFKVLFALTSVVQIFNSILYCHFTLIGTFLFNYFNLFLSVYSLFIWVHI